MENLNHRAFEILKKARDLTKSKKFEESAQCYRVASELFKQIDDQKNEKLALARSFDAQGKYYSISGEFERSRNSFKSAENLFNELNMKMQAFYSINFLLDTIKYQYKKTKQLPGDLEFAYFESFLSDYIDYSAYCAYTYQQLEYLKYKSLSDNSIEWAQKALEVSRNAETRFNDGTFKAESLHWERIYLINLVRVIEKEKFSRENLIKIAEIRMRLAEIELIRNPADNGLYFDEYAPSASG